MAPHLALAVAAGSALGAVLRAGLSLALAGTGAGGGTLLVNVLGAFLIGLHAAWLDGRGGAARHPVQAHFVMAGVCGGFTTFSVFSLESVLLLQAGALGQAAGLVTVSLLLWMLAVWAGAWLGKRLTADEKKAPPADRRGR